MKLKKGNWYGNEENTAIYKVTKIKNNGDYWATGLNSDGEFLKKHKFGNLKDLNCLRPFRLKKSQVIEKLLINTIK